MLLAAEIAFVFSNQHKLVMIGIIVTGDFLRTPTAWFNIWEFRHSERYCALNLYTAPTLSVAVLKQCNLINVNGMATHRKTTQRIIDCLNVFDCRF